VILKFYLSTNFSVREIKEKNLRKGKFVSSSFPAREILGEERFF